MNAIPIAAILLLFLYYQRSNGWRFGIVSLLFSTYLTMAIGSITLELFDWSPRVFPFHFTAMAFLALSFLIVFYGFGGYRDAAFATLRIENFFLYRQLELFLIVGGFTSLVFFSPFALNVFRDDIRMRRIEQNMFGATHLAEWGLINSFCSLFASLFIVSLLCALINMCTQYSLRSPTRAVLLFSSSLSYVVYVFAYAGRDGIVFWLMSYAFCLLLMRAFISRDNFVRLGRAFLLSGVMLSFPFITISVARFGGSPTGTVIGLLSYSGQQIGNFNDRYYVIDTRLYGRAGFPVFVAALDGIGFRLPQDDEAEYADERLLHHGVKPWVFATYIGSFLGDFGKLGTLITLTLLALLTRRITASVRTRGVFPFSSLLLFVLIYQMSYWGVFYNCLYSLNWYCIFMILLSCLFAFTPSRNWLLIHASRIVPPTRAPRTRVTTHYHLP